MHLIIKSWCMCEGYCSFPVCLSVVSICLSVSLCVCLSACLCVSLSVCVCVCVSLCLSALILALQSRKWLVSDTNGFSGIFLVSSFASRLASEADFSRTAVAQVFTPFH